MALGKKKGNKKVETIKPEEEAVTAEAELVEDPANETKTEEKVEAKETPAKEEKGVAKVGTGTALSKNITGGKLKFLVDEYQDAMEPVGWGVVPKITAKSGEFFDSDNKSLGNLIEFTLVSFNDSFLVSTGTNDKEDRKHCRYSYDNEYLNDDSGQTVKEYVQELKDNGYEKPQVKKYLEVNVILNDAEEDSEHIESLVQLSLSPESVKQFHSYKLQSTIKAARGVILPADVGNIVAKAKNVTRGDYTYTIYTFKCISE